MAYLHILLSGSDIYAQSGGDTGRREMMALYQCCDAAQGCKKALLIPEKHANAGATPLTFLLLTFQSEADARRFVHVQTRTVTKEGVRVIVTPSTPKVEKDWKRLIAGLAQHPKIRRHAAVRSCEFALPTDSKRINMDPQGADGCHRTPLRP